MQWCQFVYQPNKTGLFKVAKLQCYGTLESDAL